MTKYNTLIASPTDDQKIQIAIANELAEANRLKRLELMVRHKIGSNKVNIPIIDIQDGA